MFSTWRPRSRPAHPILQVADSPIQVYRSTGYKPKDTSARHSLRFRNKLTVLPLKTYGAGKISQSMPDLRVLVILGEPSGRRRPPLLFWGCIIQRKGFLQSVLVQNVVSWFFRAYRQVHWLAAPFCSTTPKQTKIPQNRPNSRVFDGLGESSGRRNLPILNFGPRKAKEKGNFWRISSTDRYTGV